MPRAYPPTTAASTGGKKNRNICPAVYDPGDLVAPSFGDRAGQSPVLLGFAGAGLTPTTAAVAAATWTGERYRLSGRPSWPEELVPQYYPRRVSDRRQGRAREAAGRSR